MRTVAPTRPNYAISFFFPPLVFFFQSSPSDCRHFWAFPLVQLVDIMKLFIMKTCPGFRLDQSEGPNRHRCRLFLKHLKLCICNTKSPLSCRVTRKTLKTVPFSRCFFLFHFFFVFLFLKAKTCESNEWTVPFHVASRCAAVSIPSTASPPCASSSSSSLLCSFFFVQLGFEEPHWHAGHVYEIYIHI